MSSKVIAQSNAKHRLAGMLERVQAVMVIAWMQLTARLPVRLAGMLAAPGGRLLQVLMRRRANIVASNLRLCFPDWDERRLAACRRAMFRELAYSFYEIAMAWCIADSRRLPPCSFSGVEHVLEARRLGRGILMVCGHFVTMEITGRYYGEALISDMVYRPLGNARLEAFQRQCRRRYAEHQIVKSEPAGILHALRAGRAVWIAPDQDFGPRRSVFVDFFGQPAATLTAIWRLARAANAVVLTMQPRRLADGSYQINIEAPLPGGDEATPQTMLRAMNQRIEAAVRAQPEQYWWLHRRFKTRPPGCVDVYS